MPSTQPGKGCPALRVIAEPILRDQKVVLTVKRKVLRGSLNR